MYPILLNAENAYTVGRLNFCFFQFFIDSIAFLGIQHSIAKQHAPPIITPDTKSGKLTDKGLRIKAATKKKTPAPITLLIVYTSQYINFLCHKKYR